MQELLNVIGGLITLSLFGGTLWQLWRHTRPDGPLKRGLVMRTEPLASELVETLSSLQGEQREDWGWYRQEDTTLLVFVEPRYTGGGDLRLETFWPYVAEVTLSEPPTVAYRAPTLAMLLAGPLFFLFIGPLLSHLMLVPRIRKRLITLASQAD
ncbi:MAG: hypothetical protein ACI8RZ_004300 [Myxococcota bacterium]|jgi:hypothetical protein